MRSELSFYKIYSVCEMALGGKNYALPNARYSGIIRQYYRGNGGDTLLSTRGLWNPVGEIHLAQNQLLPKIGLA